MLQNKTKKKEEIGKERKTKNETTLWLGEREAGGGNHQSSIINGS